MARFSILLAMVAGLVVAAGCDGGQRGVDGDNDGAEDDTESGTGDDPNYCAGGGYDIINNLCWQNPDAGLFNWADAVAYCDDLVLAGQDDWYLPTVYEFIDMLGGCYSIDFEQPQSGSCDECLDSATCQIIIGWSFDSNTYWSSTLSGWGYSEEDKYAWKVSFSNGSVSPVGFMTGDLNVRCVRQGK